MLPELLRQCFRQMIINGPRELSVPHLAFFIGFANLSDYILRQKLLKLDVLADVFQTEFI